MIEKPKKTHIEKQDDTRPINIEQLIEKYDLENVWVYIDKIIDHINNLEQ